MYILAVLDQDIDPILTLPLKNSFSPFIHTLSSKTKVLFMGVVWSQY